MSPHYDLSPTMQMSLGIRSCSTSQKDIVNYSVLIELIGLIQLFVLVTAFI